MENKREDLKRSKVQEFQHMSRSSRENNRKHKKKSKIQFKNNTEGQEFPKSKDTMSIQQKR